MTATEPHATWISVAEATRRLAASRATVRALVRQGRLSVLRVPGARPKLLLEEVDRLAAASLSPPATPNAHRATTA